MKLEKVSVSDLKQHPKNPKKHEQEKIADSITEFGYVEPIIIDEKNVILIEDLTVSINDKGVIDVDTVKGCYK